MWSTAPLCRCVETIFSSRYEEAETGAIGNLNTCRDCVCCGPLGSSLICGESPCGARCLRRENNRGVCCNSPLPFVFKRRLASLFCVSFFLFIYIAKSGEPSMLIDPVAVFLLFLDLTGTLWSSTSAREKALHVRRPLYSWRRFSRLSREQRYCGTIGGLFSDNCAKYLRTVKTALRP